MEEAASSVKMGSEVESPSCKRFFFGSSSKFSSDQQKYFHVKIPYILAHGIYSDHCIAFYAQMWSLVLLDSFN